MNNCCFLHILSIMEEHRMKYDAIRKKINALAAVLLAAVLLGGCGQTAAETASRQADYSLVNIPV